MYPMRYLGYGAFGGYGGYGNYGNYNYNNNGYGYSPYGNPGYTNPGWFTGSILQRANRGAGGPGLNGYSATGNPNFANVNNNAQANASTPPNVLKYGGAQLPAGNQATNPSGQPDANAIYPNSMTGAAPGVNGNGNFSNSAYPAPGYSSMQYPGAAPNGQGNFQNNGQFPNQNRHGKIKYKKNKNQQHADQSGQSAANGAQGNPSGNGSGAGSGAAAGGAGAGGTLGSGITSSSTAPFAGAFINNINSEYKGDIRKALSNPQTRAWAQSLGIMNSGSNNFSISDERSGVIEHVLKDSSLDPVSKLDAVKILLRN
jgi:hypothetical protein